MTSTTAELAGFSVVSVAAWLISPILGLFVAGLSLLLVGYATEDAQAVIHLRRVKALIAARRARRVVRRQQRKASKAAAS